MATACFLSNIFYHVLGVVAPVPKHHTVKLYDCAQVSGQYRNPFNFSLGKQADTHW
jgi:hypothetical protein